MDVSLGLEPRVRIGVEYCLCLITGIFLWLLESTSAESPSGPYVQAAPRCAAHLPGWNVAAPLPECLEMPNSTALDSRILVPATSEEAAMRSSLGLAFGPAGRLSLFLFLALCSAPAIHCDHTLIECYASGGAVAFLIVSALLQAWMLSCAPEYRGTVVASLETQKIKTDSTPDVFPQIYQRDEGTHLHLGVLIPGFASRDTCTMCAPA